MEPLNDSFLRPKMALVRPLLLNLASGPADAGRASFPSPAPENLLLQPVPELPRKLAKIHAFLASHRSMPAAIGDAHRAIDELPTAEPARMALRRRTSSDPPPPPSAAAPTCAALLAVGCKTSGEIASDSSPPAAECSLFTSASSDFFYVDPASDSHEPLGPTPLSELRQKLCDAEITPATLIWTEGMASWERACTALPPQLDAEAPAAAAEWPQANQRHDAAAEPAGLSSSLLESESL